MFVINGVISILPIRTLLVVTVIFYFREVLTRQSPVEIIFRFCIIGLIQFFKQIKQANL